ncbi:MAG TPA: NHLP leader peptide family RiPP precursor [Verrucomicrobiaceae bacterium]|jgi:hypothetical protein
MTQQEKSKKLSQLVAKCWADDGFKRKLLSDTATTLKSEGVEIPAGMSVKALENTDKLFHLVIPPRPAEMSEEDLDKVAGGDACGAHKTRAMAESSTTGDSGGSVNILDFFCGPNTACRNVRW